MNIIAISAVVLLVCSAVSGFVGFQQGQDNIQVKWDKDVAERQQLALEQTQLAEKVNREIYDDLARGKDNAIATVAALHRRLRDAKASSVPVPSGPSCGDNVPAVRILPDRTREDLVAAAERADKVVRLLSACQKFIRERQKVGQDE